MKCPICASGATRLYSGALSPDLLICKQCRHIFFGEHPSEAELTAYYENQYTDTHNQSSLQEAGREHYRSHANHLAQLLGQEIGSITYLDFGCSYPVFLQEAKGLGAKRVIGVDPALQVATPGIEIVSPSAMETIEDGCVDAIRFSHVLEHMIDPVETLKGAVKKVRPGGLVCITQPNIPILKFGPSERIPNDAVYPEHLHFFSPISLVLMAEKCGLRVHQFFTQQKADETLESFGGNLDLFKSRVGMYKYRKLGSAADKANYPFYAGRGSVLFAFKLRS